MTIKVEACWSGGDRHYFRLILPDGDREFVSGLKWTRQVASYALDLLERVYGFHRCNVRFRHH